MLLQFTTVVFLIVLLCIYHIVPGRFRGLILLPGSALFVYFNGGLSALLVLCVITVFTYLAGLMVGDGRRGVMIAFVALLVAVLAGWKYIPWFMGIQGTENAVSMPIGLSFYTFQAISYVVDVYTGKLAGPEKKPIRFALYMMWFPKWMSGPIERCGDFMKQLEESARVRLFSMEYVCRFEKAMSYLVWGMFMKLVIADRIGIVVDSAFADIQGCGFITLILASLLYTVQIYCDFAGYTNSMIGISLLLGINLTQNFLTPYFAENTVEFWRRWHVSLSSWLRDYVYIPLGGNRKGAVRKRINTLIVFLVCGMWHGAGLSFIVWGLLHGLFNVLTDVAGKTRAVFLTKGVFGRVLTFCLVSFAWIFFRAADLGQALQFIAGMIPGVNSAAPIAGLAVTDSVMMGISVMEWWIAAISLVVLVVLDVYAYRRQDIVPALVADKWRISHRTALLTFLAFVILIFGKYGSGENIRSFMYMQF
ncbi:MBOAT family O-acyltransferase [Butyrivibrio sp. XPD2006]|uniref:MBOAT family O-acyltransferase n=1 Tax=Butyrivibrio sp. XPD2006 TaxID=1280668 RepID=UPI0003B40039|nr:MBOAT family O-acyltransferase [Butyrivibrio sp. XPD2006]